MTEHAIVAADLGKRYGRTWGLRNCSLEISGGRVVGLVGPNGAGKTTLMNMLVGLASPTTGHLTVLGEPVGTQPLRGVAYIDQEHSMYRDFRVGEMLRAAGTLNERWHVEIATNRLGELDIPLDRRMGQLSGGQKAQVALAIALAKRPEMLVLDEPVASLDPLARKEMMSALMGAKADSDCTVVLSSHVVSELERLCDYLVVLERGEVKLTGDIDDLLEEHRMLTGDSSHADPVAARVVHRDVREDRADVLVRGPVPVEDAGWEVRRVSLESLVTGYMSASSREGARTEEVAA